MTAWSHDLRDAFRLLCRKPGLAAVTTLILALGIGANSVVFSVVNAVMLRPLPYQDPHQLVVVLETNPGKGWDRFPVSIPNFLDWQAQSTVFADLAVMIAGSVTLSGGEGAERLATARVSPSFFAVWRLLPVLGRDFLPAEADPGRATVAVISQGLWQRRFGADPEVVGRPIVLDGVSHTVVGIMPAAARLPGREVDLWLPLVIDPEHPSARGQHVAYGFGRLKPGVTLAQARSEMTTIAHRLAEQYPIWNAGYGVLVVPLHEALVADVRAGLLVLLAAVALILLIACCNVANLLLVRAAQRQQEIAVRAALGADRRRLIGHLLSESVLLAVLGGSGGLLLAFAALRPLLALAPPDVPRLGEVGVDLGVLGFTLLLSLLTAVLVGLVPALRGSRPDLNEALKEGERQGAGRRGHRLGNVLVVVEVALVLILAIAATLLIRSVRRLQEVDPGFRTEQVLALQITLPQYKYPAEHQPAAFFQRLLAELRALPGVRSAAVANVAPLDFRYYRFAIRDRPPAAPGAEPNVMYKVVSPDYFKTLGIPLIRGRTINERDVRDQPLVLVVNETMVRRFFPDQDPIGQKVNFVFRSDPVWQEIVGVVGDVRQEGPDQEPYQAIYGAHYQWGVRSACLLLHTAVEPLSLVPAVRGKLRRLDPELPIFDVRTLDQAAGAAVADRRSNMWLLSLFAALGLLLGAVGIYGVMARFVSRRTREIGIRMALGAGRRDVLRWVIRQTMAPALAGIALGLVGAFALTRFLSSLLFGVGAADPLTFTAVTLLMAAVAFAACYLPARRASRVDPKVALTCE